MIRSALAPIARVTLARPEQRNALSLAMLESIANHVRQLAATPSVRVIILDHEGDVFCAGGDLEELKATCNPEGAARLRHAGLQALTALAQVRTPVIAQMAGPAIGGGAELALACDFRLMQSDAYFHLKHIHLAATPAWDTVRRLVSLVGGAHATSMLLRGRRVPALEAVALGLAAAVSSERLHEETMELAEELAALPPFALGQMKRALRAPEAEGPAFLASWASSEHYDRMHQPKRAL